MAAAPADQLRRRRLRAGADPRLRRPSPSSARTACRVHYDGKVAKDIDLVGHRGRPISRSRTTSIAAGRPFTAQEVRSAAAGAGDRPGAGRASCFAGVDPIGKKVADRRAFPTGSIGVVEKQGTLFGISLDKFAIMPFNAPARRLICPHQHPRRADRPAPTIRPRCSAPWPRRKPIMRSRRAAQARAGEQLRVPDRGGRAGQLAEDLAGSSSLALPGPGGHLAGGGRHRDHEHHADGGQRADP